MGLTNKMMAAISPPRSAPEGQGKKKNPISNEHRRIKLLGEVAQLEPIRKRGRTTARIFSTLGREKEAARAMAAVTDGR